MNLWEFIVVDQAIREFDEQQERLRQDPPLPPEMQACVDDTMKMIRAHEADRERIRKKQIRAIENKKYKEKLDIYKEKPFIEKVINLGLLVAIRQTINPDFFVCEEEDELPQDRSSYLTDDYNYSEDGLRYYEY